MVVNIPNNSWLLIVKTARRPSHLGFNTALVKCTYHEQFKSEFTNFLNEKLSADFSFFLLKLEELRVTNADLASAKQALSNENASLSSQLTEMEGRAATLGKNKKSLELQLDEVKNALEEETRVCM